MRQGKARQGLRAIPRAPANAPAVNRTADLGSRAVAATGRLISSSPNLGAWLLVSRTSPSSNAILQTGLLMLLLPACMRCILSALCMSRLPSVVASAGNIGTHISTNRPQRSIPVSGICIDAVAKLPLCRRHSRALNEALGPPCAAMPPATLLEPRSA